MKAFRKTISSITVIAAICFLSSQVAAQSNNAKGILEKASEACKKQTYIEYNSKTEQGELVIEAHIIQEQAQVKDIGIGAAKLIAKGQRKIREKVQPFEFSYDGTQFKFIETGNGALKKLKDPTPRTVGRLLGLYYYNAVSGYLIRPNGLDFLLKDDAIMEYVEKTDVAGRSAHHIKVTRMLKRPGTDQLHKSVSSWFIDAESFLPVKRITGSIVSSTEYLSLRKPAIENIYDINPENVYAEAEITGNEPKTEGLPKPGTTLPDFELAGQDGVLKSWEDVKGKVTLIDFWGTWCGPCLKAMPKLQALYEKYAEKGFKVVGISVADKPGKAERFVEKHAYTYKFLFQGDSYAKGLKLDTYPTVFLIDESGKVLHAEKGNREGIEQTLERIIKQELKTQKSDGKTN